VQPDLPMWIGGSSEAAIRRTARFGTGWQAGPEGPEEAGRVVAKIRAAAIDAGRPIDDDHYGAGFPFYFGKPDDPALARSMAAYEARTGRDPQHYYAVGDAAAIVARIGAYVAAGVQKFVLRPVGVDDDAVMAQSRLLIEQVLPEVHARWPKHAVKAAS
jgi:alkanesulfonate monooxygenase SsuD/methylene tetrahydromethanopterin reductase-like flavin-dependent oxidoreductase (luciferase family)